MSPGCNRIALRRYLDGTLDDMDERLEFLEHVGSCQYCWDRVYESRKMDGWERKYKGKKPASEEPEKTEEDMATNRERILEYLAEHPKATAADIRSGTGIGSSSVSATMTEFTSKGKVVRYSDGISWRYSLPNPKTGLETTNHQRKRAGAERSNPDPSSREGVKPQDEPTAENRAFPWLNGFKATTAAKEEVTVQAPKAPPVHTSGYLVPQNELDPECEAIRIIWGALRGLDGVAVSRILAYMRNRFGVEAAA